MTLMALVYLYVYVALMILTYILSVEMAGRDEFGLHVIPGILGAVFMPLVLPVIMLIHLAIWTARKMEWAGRQARPSPGRRAVREAM